MKALAIGALAAAWACGNAADRGAAPAPDDAGAGALVGPRARPLGARDLAGFAYSRGPGREPFAAGLEAARRSAWPDAEARARQALEADAGHLEAHWLLAKALAAQARFADVGEPLSAAVAGDWLRWGPRVLDDAGLAGYRASPQFAAVRELVDHYRDEMRRVARDGVWVVGRRGAAAPPKGTGAVAINHRAEIYIHDPESRRWVRASRTDGALVGMVTSPAANEAAYVAYRRVVLPDDEQRAAGRLPVIARVEIGTIDADGPRMSAREVVLSDVSALELSWVPGKDRGGASAPALVARVWHARKDGTPAARPKTLLLDAEAGTASPTDVAPGADALRVAYDRVWLRRSRVDGVAADWDGDGAAGAFALEETRRTITLADGQLAERDSMRWSARRARLAFATRPADACADDPALHATTLFVVDAATGRMREVARGTHDFAPVWLDDARLAYVVWVDGAPGVRIHDAEQGRELAALDAAGGVGTTWLPARTRCASLPGEPVDDASEEPGWDEEWNDDGVGAPAPAAGADTRPARN